MRHPHALKKGDTIGIAASASPFDRKAFTKGVHLLERLGFNCHFRDDIFDQSRYLAGSDERRADELMELIRSPKIHAIMFARGGYGCQRLIPKLDIKVIAEHKKPLVGFSDITALLTYLRQNADFPTFYGPVLTQLGNNTDEQIGNSLATALTTSGPLAAIESQEMRTIIAGTAEGKLVGGCLALINSSMGTPYELETDGAIIMIEDVGEKVYVLDRMLTQLKNSGKLSKASGIAFGSLIPLPDEPCNVEEMIRDVLSDYDKPVIMGLPAGHGGSFITLPFGANCRLCASEGAAPQLEFLTGIL